MLAIAAAEDLFADSVDYGKALLYGEVEEEFQMNQPGGFEDEKGPKKKKCLLQKALYAPK